MAILKINSVDFSDLVSGLKVGYETLVSNNSGRNANGDTVVDVINMKRKIYVSLRATTFDEMQRFLGAIAPYVVTVEYLDPRDNTLKSATTYTGTPEPEYYNVSKTIFKAMNLNFIEL
jgi:hypothetical protein